MASLTHWCWLQPNRAIRLYLAEGEQSAAQLAAEVLQLSQQLQQLQPHGNLAVCQQNPAQLLRMALACLQAGWTFQPISPRWPLVMRTQLAKQVQSDYCWPLAEFSADASLPGLTLREATSARTQPLTSLQVSTNQLCSTLFTSGSTGRPKGVSHRVEQHLFAAERCQSVLQLTPQSCWLMSLPLYHAAGYAILMRCLRAGAAIALPQKSGVSLAQLQQHPITHVSLVATQLQRLLQHAEFNANHLTLTHIMLGGGPVPTPLIQQASARGFKLSLSYGMTESAAAIALAEVDHDAGIKLGQNRNLRVYNGEIQLRGRQLALNYQQETGLEPLLNPQQWFETGDLAQLNRGKLYIQGRKDNRFISGGENIQPELVEFTLQQHPSVAMAVVVPIADREFGQRPVAFIQWHHEPSNTDALAHWLQGQLPRFMCPVRYLAWPASIAANQKIIRADFLVANKGRMRELNHLFISIKNKCLKLLF